MTRFGDIGPVSAETALAVAAFLFLAAILAWPLIGIARRRHRRRLWKAQRDLSTLRAMSWQDFERLTGETFRRMGYQVEETGGGGQDEGIDLRLTRAGKHYVVQCKHYRRGSVGAPVIREMVGVAVHAAAAGVFVVTCGRFTRAARSFARGKAVTLIDGARLIEIIRLQQGRAGMPRSPGGA